MKTNFIKGVIIAGLAISAPICFVGCKEDKKPEITITDYSITGYDNSYFTNETFTLTGTVLNLTMSDGSTNAITVTSDMLKQVPDLTVAGTKTVTIIYNEKEYTFNITVEQYVPTINLIRANNLKLNYFVGDEVSVSGATLTISTDGVESNVNLTKEMIENLNTTTAGNRKLTINYQGKTLMLDYVVTAVEIQEITSVDGLSTEYFVGQSLNVSAGAKLYYKNNNNTTGYVQLTEDMISGFVNTSVGDKSFTITYSGKTISVPYVVKVAKAVNISIKDAIKTTYTTDDTAFDVTGGKILVNYEDNSNKTIDITTSMLTSFDNTAGTHTATITFENKTVNFNYTVNQLYNIVKAETNCSISISSVSALSTTEISITVTPNTGYKIDKLVYITGIYSGSVFTPNGEEVTIVNNKFNMPNSDVKIVCICVEEVTTTKVTVSNVELNAETTLIGEGVDWLSENILLTNAKLIVNQDPFTLSDIENFNDTQTWDLSSENASYDLESLIISNSSFTLDLEFCDAGDLVGTDETAFTPSVSENDIEITHVGNEYYINHNITVTIAVDDTYESTSGDIEIDFTLKVCFSVEN